MPAGAAATIAVDTPSPTQSDQFAHLSETTAGIRGRTFTAPVTWEITDTQTLIDTVMLPELDAELLGVDERLLWKLGLLPTDTRLRESLIPLLTEQIIGLYVPSTEKMYAVQMSNYLASAGLPPDAEEPLFRFTLVHELTHALQDQLFDLESFTDPDAVKSGAVSLDAMTARMALAEGDAMFVSMDYMLGQLPNAATPSGILGSIPSAEVARLVTATVGASPEPDSQLATAPPYLRDSLIAPYIYGLVFVHHLYQAGAWDAVDAAYTSHRPESTEQILHPQRYVDGDHPTVVPDFGITDLLAREWTRDTPTMLGELDIRLLARQYLGPERESAIGEGWDGDRAEVFVNREDPKRVLLVWASVWDTPEDAREFGQAYAQILAKRYGAPAGSTATTARWATADGEVSVERRGNWVLTVDALDGATGGAVSHAVWAKLDGLLPQP